ncbi:hypothetical protein C8F01DRAFT_976393, partial [Mycena amicta]
QKEGNQKRDARTTNWFHPLLFKQIEMAAVKAGRPWKPVEIVREAKKMDGETFAKLTPQVVGRWIDKDAKRAGESKWKDSVLKNVAKGNTPGGHTTRAGILQPYPEIRKAINDDLVSLRQAGVPLTLLTIRGIMVAHIQSGAPHLFHTSVRSDGTQFRCSEGFI